MRKKKMINKHMIKKYRYTVITSILLAIGMTTPVYAVKLDEQGINGDMIAVESDTDLEEEKGEQEIASQKAAIVNSILVSGNIDKQNYNTWSKPMTSFLAYDKDYGYTRVQYADGIVYVEKYSNDYSFQSTQQINAELSLFGGFYDDGTNYYLVFGQNNPQEDDNCEVIRIVKYSRDWERQGAASVYGANTYIPFDAGSLRMTFNDGMLYIRTAHEMYASSDGLHHQANMTIKVNVADMKVADCAYEVQNSSAGYVSHSFNQFIKLDNGNIVALDHGDAYPRSAVLLKYSGDALGVWGSVDALDTIEYYGKIGANNTDATVGGLEISDTSYLTVGSSGPQDGSERPYWGGRNIYVTATPKNNFDEDATSFTWITNDADDSVHVYGTPQLVEINKNRYLLMWSQTDRTKSYNDKTKNSIKYVFLDGYGNPVSQLYSGNACLSDCQPIYNGNKVVWYVADGEDVKFYRINENTGMLTVKSMINPSDNTFDTDPDVPDSGWYIRDVPLIEGNWKYESVKYVFENGIMGGVGGTRYFQPDQPLTRAMFATVLYRMAGEPTVPFKDKFTDVKAGEWYSSAIIWANQNDIVNGYSTGDYGINDNITREQIAKMLCLYGELQGYDVSGKTTLDSFPDKDAVSGWATEYMQWAVNAQMINGKHQSDGTFLLDPKGHATRAECAKMLMMFMKKYS